MDDPALPPVEHRQALAGLARLNAFSGSASALWPEIRHLARELGRPLRLLDVATGAGDVPAVLLKRAARAGISIEFSACDISPVAMESASDRFRAAGVKVKLFTIDALAESLPTGFDVVVCSLFLHHLSADNAVSLLRNLSAATDRLVLVNDLGRSRLNLGLVWLGSQLLTRSRVVHVDGPRSVRAAFTSVEAAELAERAGLTDAVVTEKFPCRWLLSWRKPT